MLVKIDTYEICNGSLSGGVAVGKLRWPTERVTDVVLPLYGFDPTLLDRIVRRTVLTFVVERTFSDANAAEVFALDLNANLPGTGTVRITPTDSVDFQDYPNARMLSWRSEENGATVTTQY